MPTLKSYTLRENPWEEPAPEAVKGGRSKDGWKHIVDFYEARERSGTAAVHKLKVVIVGAIFAGKTTLARGLREGKPVPTREDERTRGVDVHISPWRPHDNNPLEVSLWDFAGHAGYYSTHQVRCWSRTVR